MPFSDWGSVMNNQISKPRHENKTTMTIHRCRCACIYQAKCCLCSGSRIGPSHATPYIMSSRIINVNRSPAHVYQGHTDRESTNNLHSDHVRNAIWKSYPNCATLLWTRLVGHISKFVVWSREVACDTGGFAFFANGDRLVRYLRACVCALLLDHLVFSVFGWKRAW